VSIFIFFFINEREQSYFLFSIMKKYILEIRIESMSLSNFLIFFINNKKHEFHEQKEACESENMYETKKKYQENIKK